MKNARTFAGLVNRSFSKSTGLSQLGKLDQAITHKLDKWARPKLLGTFDLYRGWRTIGHDTSFHPNQSDTAERCVTAWLQLDIEQHKELEQAVFSAIPALADAGVLHYELILCDFMGVHRDDTLGRLRGDAVVLLSAPKGCRIIGDFNPQEGTLRHAEMSPADIALLDDHKLHATYPVEKTDLIDIKLLEHDNNLRRNYFKNNCMVYLAISKVFGADKRAA